MIMWSTYNVQIKCKWYFINYCNKIELDINNYEYNMKEILKNIS